MSVLFDDLAVRQARRRLPAGPYPAALSTLLSSDSGFEGAVSVIRSGRPYDDPLAPRSRAARCSSRTDPEDVARWAQPRTSLIVLESFVATIG